MEKFIINNVFNVLPEKNTVNKVKLEPRIMKLLCLLAENPRRVVSREEIIENIWKGYGGGDEGLTQAISFLRKLLNDEEKKIIETVPKSGYVLNADIELIQETKPNLTEKKKKNLAVYAIVAIIILGFIWLVLSNKTAKVPYAPKAPDTEIKNPALAPKNEQ